MAVDAGRRSLICAVVSVSVRTFSGPFFAPIPHFPLDWPMFNYPGFDTSVENPMYEHSKGPTILLDALIIPRAAKQPGAAGPGSEVRMLPFIAFC